MYHHSDFHRKMGLFFKYFTGFHGSVKSKKVVFLFKNARDFT